MKANLYKKMYGIKKYLLLSIFWITSMFAATAAAPTSFLPMEDELSSIRRPVYGASVEVIKPYRQVVAIASPTVSSFMFGLKDFWACALLVGTYFLFIRKKSRTRSAGL